MRATLILSAGLLCGLCCAGQSSQLPVYFAATGRTGPRDVHFVAKGSGITAHFGPESLQYRVGNSRVGITFAGGNPNVRLLGEQAQPGKVNFLMGSEPGWRTDLPTYSGIVYRDLYPRIDLRYGASKRLLKSEFTVAPGGDPAAIRIRYQGAENVQVMDNGSLSIDVSGERLSEAAPVAFQDVGGERVPIAVRFAVLEGGLVGFEVGGYDRTRSLIIDPELSYSTLLGGRGMDTVYAIAVDGSGNVYVAGRTDSYDLPVVNGAQSGSGGGADAFVAKLNAGGTALVFCTYIGGSGDDRAYGIAIDTTGSAYVTGTTYSRDFPVRNPMQSRNGGTRNAFVLKLTTSGGALSFSTYLGGNGGDTGYGIAIDPSGYVYVAGDTTSTNFPATDYQVTNRGLQDGFVTKISADGRQILYSTYLGGTAEDHVAAIAVDGAGVVSVTGSTYSVDLPASTGQRVSGGSRDAFVARLNAAGSALAFCSYLGGSGGGVGYPEEGRAIAVDSSGNVYVAGITSSANFPLARANQSKLRGMTDAFVSIFSAAGVLTYSSFLGGSGWDSANAIALEAGGGILVAGETTSADLPVVNGAQSANAGDYDAFVIRMSPAGDAITYASYLGGNGSDTALGLAVDPSGNVYIAGQTQSTNFPFLKGFQSSNPGNFGGFIAKWVFNSRPVPLGVSPAAGGGATQQFRLEFSDESGAMAISNVSVLFQTSASAAGGCAVIYERALNTLVVLSNAGDTRSNPVVPGGSGSAENSQCALAAAGSAASVAGTTLTLELALTFKPGFKGSKNIYLQATNKFGSSGWQMKGTWTASEVSSGSSVKIGVVRNAAWILDANGTRSFESNGDRTFNWGVGGSIPVTGDWSGSGRSKAGFYKDGLWYLDYDGDGAYNPATDKLYGFGWAAPGVMPQVGDWNGDGRSKVGVFYNGFWYLDYNGNGTWDGPTTDRVYSWGWDGVSPLTGDWNGDGRTKIGFFINGFWYLDYNGDGIWQPASDRLYGWGWNGVTPVVGDWNGDRRKKIGFVINGFWYLDYDGDGIWDNGVNDRQYGFGWAGVTPLVADWNGDGRDKIGAFANGTWYLDWNGTGSGASAVTGNLGQAGDFPVTGRW